MGGNIAWHAPGMSMPAPVVPGGPIQDQLWELPSALQALWAWKGITETNTTNNNSFLTFITLYYCLCSFTIPITHRHAYMA